MFLYFKTIFYKILLSLRGVKIGENFKCGNLPIIESDSYFINLKIGKNVTLRHNCEFFLRRKGQILLDDNVKIDSSVRLLSSNSALLQISADTNIGKNTIINAGDKIHIGKSCLISANCIIQSSSHIYKNKKKSIKNQGYIHREIFIEDDVWIGANSLIHNGVRLKKGTVIGALSKISKSSRPYEIHSNESKIRIRARKWEMFSKA